MTAWELVGIGSNTTVTSGDCTLNLPSGIAAGDLIVAHISYRDTAAFTAPSGGEWTIHQQISDGNTSTSTNRKASGLIASCIRGASNPNLAFTRSGGNVALGTTTVWRADSPIQFDVTSQGRGAALTSTTTITGVTTTADDALILLSSNAGAAVGLDWFDAATSPATASEGTPIGTTGAVTPEEAWVYVFGQTTTTGADAGLGIARAVKSTAGATGSFSVDGSSTNPFLLFSVAFKGTPSSPGNAPAASAAGTGGSTEGAPRGQATAPAAPIAGSGAVGAMAATGGAQAPATSSGGFGAVAAPTGQGKGLASGLSNAGAGASQSATAAGKGRPGAANAAGGGDVTSPRATGQGLAPGGSAVGGGGSSSPSAVGSEVVPVNVEGLGGITSPTATGQGLATGAALAGTGGSSGSAARGQAQAPAGNAAGVGGGSVPAGQGRAIASGATSAGTGGSTSPVAFGRITSPSAQVTGAGGTLSPPARGQGTATGVAVAGTGTFTSDRASNMDGAIRIAGAGGVDSHSATGQGLAIGHVVRGTGRVGFGQPLGLPNTLWFRNPLSGAVLEALYRHGRAHILSRRRGLAPDPYQSLLGLQPLDTATGVTRGPVIVDADLDSPNLMDDP